MVLYRFCQLSQSLKFTPAGTFLVSSVPKANGGVKHVYKPILTAPPPPIASAPSHAASSASAHGHAEHGHGHGHGHDHDHGHRKFPESWKGWENWKSWKDVPDHLVPTYSLRDPNNAVYSDPRYIAIKKKQIWAQTRMDLPSYLMFGTRDKVVLGLLYTAIAIVAANTFYDYYLDIYKQYYPDSNLFYFF